MFFKRKDTKKFKEADNTAVFTTRFVLEDKKDITLVTHEKEDGAWQFFSNDPFDHYEEVARIAGLGQIVKLDSSLLQLAAMPEGYYAQRSSRNEAWVIRKREDEQGSA